MFHFLGACFLSLRTYQWGIGFCAVESYSWQAKSTVTKPRCSTGGAAVGPSVGGVPGPCSARALSRKKKSRLCFRGMLAAICISFYLPAPYLLTMECVQDRQNGSMQLAYLRESVCCGILLLSVPKSTSRTQIMPGSTAAQRAVWRSASIAARTDCSQLRVFWQTRLDTTSLADTTSRLRCTTAAFWAPGTPKLPNAANR